MPDGITIRLRSRGAQTTTAWLEVGYDGLEPPTGLFDDLAMVGWRPPTPEPPPKHAIDWSTPDPATGQRFTIRPWRVEGARVEPPTGSGPRRQWTPDERRVFLTTLEGVLHRHGLALGSGDERAAPPGAPSIRPAPPPPASAVAPLPPPPVSAPPPPDPGPFDGLDPDAFYRVVAPLPRGVQRDAVTSGLAAVGLSPEWTEVRRTVTSRYRGSVSEEEVRVPAVAVLCPGNRVVDVAAALLEQGVIGGPAALDVERVTGEELAVALEAAVGTEVAATLARLSVVVEPHLAVEVAAALEVAGAIGVTRRRTRRLVEQRFRGSITEVAIPAVAVSARCEPSDAPGLALVAAAAAGTRADEIVVELPASAAVPPAAEPATPTEPEHPLVS